MLFPQILSLLLVLYTPIPTSIYSTGDSTTVIATVAEASSAVAATIIKIAATTTNDIFMSCIATTVCSNQVDTTGKFPSKILALQSINKLGELKIIYSGTCVI